MGGTLGRAITVGYTVMDVVLLSTVVRLAVGSGRRTPAYYFLLGSSTCAAVTDLLITVESTEEALQAATLFFQYYRENANFLERTYDFIERVAIEKVRRETVYAPIAVQQGLRERLRKSKRLARDAWLEGDEPRHPTQFVQIEPLEKVMQ